MIRHFLHTLSAGAAIAIIAQAAPAQAADPALIPMAAPVLQQAASTLTEFASGWYLRGDVGYRWTAGDTQAAAAPAITSSSFGDNFSFGAGVGYQRDWFRADLTFDWAGRADYRGDTVAVPGFYTGRIQTMTALANVYIDLGTWMGVTPYIGGGVGASSQSTREFASANAIATAATLDRSDWGFAWAYMAGISYRVSNNLLVDVGYRHIEHGNNESWVLLPGGNQVTIHKLRSDEVRVGMRYQID